MYQLTSGDTIIRLADKAFIPSSLENYDYLEYLKWVSDGNEPLPYVPPTPVDNINNLQEAKKLMETIIKTTAYQYLLPTDWYIVRFTETTTEIPENISTFRSTIRTESSTKISTVNSKETLEHLKDYLRSDQYSTWTKL